MQHSYHSSCYAPIVKDNNINKHVNTAEVLEISSNISQVLDSSVSVNDQCVDCTDDIFQFRPLIQSLKDIVTCNGEHIHEPKFYLCKSGRLITLTWEPFYGSIITSNTGSFDVIHNLKWLPAYTVELPVVLYSKNIRCNGSIVVSPDYRHIITFQLQTGVFLRAGDNLRIPGGCCTWLSMD